MIFGACVAEVGSEDWEGKLSNDPSLSYNQVFQGLRWDIIGLKIEKWCLGQQILLIVLADLWDVVLT